MFVLFKKKAKPAPPPRVKSELEIQVEETLQNLVTLTEDDKIEWTYESPQDFRITTYHALVNESEVEVRVNNGLHLYTVSIDIDGTGVPHFSSPFVALSWALRDYKNRDRTRKAALMDTLRNEAIKEPLGRLQGALQDALLDKSVSDLIESASDLIERLDSYSHGDPKPVEGACSE
jgi:hypothetical protein